MARKQTLIPGTEPKADADLEEAADGYHEACATRRGAQATERDRRSALLALVEERIKAGDLRRPDGDNTCVYEYTDEDGKKRRVHYVGGKAKVKVNGAKRVDEAEDDDASDPE